MIDGGARMNMMLTTRSLTVAGMLTSKNRSKAYYNLMSTGK